MKAIICAAGIAGLTGTGEHRRTTRRRVALAVVRIPGVTTLHRAALGRTRDTIVARSAQTGTGAR